MGDEMFADPAGLAHSAENYDEKAAQLHNIASRIQELIDPGYLSKVIGNDHAANQFLAVHIKAATDMRDGVQIWGDAIRATGDGVRGSARVLANTEHTNTDTAATFARSMTTDTGGGTNTPDPVSGSTHDAFRALGAAPLTDQTRFVDPVPETSGVPSGGLAGDNTSGPHQADRALAARSFTDQTPLVDPVPETSGVPSGGLAGDNTPGPHQANQALATRSFTDQTPLVEPIEDGTGSPHHADPPANP
jgi:hypothetical protein